MNKILNTIGLAYRAKKLIVSIENIIEFGKNKKIYLVFVSNDLSENSMNELKRLSELLCFQIRSDFSSLELSSALGLKNVKAVALIDKGFYELIN